MLLAWYYIFLHHLLFNNNINNHLCYALSTTTTSSTTTTNNNKTYNYFAYGSNMASSTMMNLRNIEPLASSAAVLPGHVLRFNIPGLPGIEPSSASVEPVAKKSGSILTNDDDDDDDDAMLLLDAIENEEHVVHGVLYKLSEDDFATICRTEGVPFAYSLHRCSVIPYVNDDGTSGSAGRDAMQRAADALGSIAKEEEEEDNGAYNRQQLKPSRKEQMTMTTATTTTNNKKTRWGVQTFTLRAARKEWRQNQKDIPPSQSYINVLLRGAKEFVLDDTYIRKLENDIPVGKTWFGKGFAENLLRIAEQRRQIR